MSYYGFSMYGYLYSFPTLDFIEIQYTYSKHFYKYITEQYKKVFFLFFLFFKYTFSYHVLCLQLIKQFL